MKNKYFNYVGFGLILGVAIGFSLEIIFLENINGLFSSIGAGLGLVVGSMIGLCKPRGNKK